MRKGELFGLRRSDVDLAADVITVARSYNRETTKGGHADVIPIATPLRPCIVDALDASRSEFVFPAADGSMRSPEADPQKVLRHALARAGLVIGYDHVCRRCKARGHAHAERHLDAVERRCPACGMRLWPKAFPRPMRFHDLRHTTATLLLRSASRSTTSSASCGTGTSGSRPRPTGTSWPTTSGAPSSRSRRARGPRSTRVLPALRAAKRRRPRPAGFPCEAAAF
jgi:integrase